MLSLYFHQQCGLESHDLPVPDFLLFVIQYYLLSVGFYSSLEISNLTVLQSLRYTQEIPKLMWFLGSAHIFLFVSSFLHLLMLIR